MYFNGRLLTPGDYFCVSIRSSSLRTIVVNDAIRFFTKSEFTHAGMITSEAGEIVESTPKHGVRISNIGMYEYMPMVFSNTSIADSTRVGMVDYAKSLVGRDGYGFLDICYLGLYTQGVRWNWLESEVLEQKDKTICSQLVAMVGQRFGITEWMCGQSQPNLVWPGELATLASIK